MRQFERLRSILADELGVSPDPTSVALYQQVLAMEGAEVPTPAERARALLSWGLIHWERKDLEEAQTTAEEARALAIDAGLGREFGEASELLALIAQWRGRWLSTFREQFLESIRYRPDLAPFVFDANLCIAEYSLYEPGGHEEARRFGRDLLAVAEETDSAQGRALATLILGEAELLGGRLEQAEDHLRGAARLHQAAHADSGHSLSLERLAETETVLGRRWQARRILGRALRLAEGTPVSSHLLPRVYGSMVEAEGDPDRASKAVEVAEQALAGSKVCRPCSIGFHVASAIACARAGDAARARHHDAEAERIVGLWPGGSWHAAVREAHAELWLADGDHTRAAELFAEAAELFAAAARPLDAERCRFAANAPSRAGSR
jgi:tetratricopeptide (TPR) repeat protein